MIGSALGRVASEFARNFAERGEVGASVCVIERGKEVLCLADGFADRARTRPFLPSTPVLVWSTTKGLAAGTVHDAMAEAGVGLEARVAEVWPEFGQSGKGAITVGELLSHRAGLAALSEPVPVEDHAAVAAALAAQAPEWHGSHGYHPRTYGYLLDELVRRMAGETLGERFARRFAGPLGLEAWIGMPPERCDEAATILAPRAGGVHPQPAFAAALADGSSLTARAFVSPKGLAGVLPMNQPEARRASYPAFGGIATARALARYYAALLEAPRRGWMTGRLVDGPDAVLQVPTAFSAGFMLDPLGAGGVKTRALLGPSARAFGHPGAGGSLAFADPDRGIAFAYAMNQMGMGVLPNARALALVEALYS